MSYIVLGSSRGLGRHIAERLAQRRVSLVLCGRSEGELNQVADVIRTSHKEAQIFVEAVDLNSVNSIDAFIGRLKNIDEPLSGLINTAAAFYKGTFLDQPLSSIDELLETTYVGVVRLISRLIKVAPYRVPFDVINITSVAAATDLNSGRSSSVHIATKAALQTFGVVLGRELCEKGIRICGIAPGTFARHGRAGIPEDVIADCIEFLIDLPPSTWVESVVLRPTGFTV